MQLFLVRGLARAYTRQPVLFCSLLAALVLAVDYITGRAIQFPIVYAIPIGLAAWRRLRGLAYGGAAILPAARLFFHFLWGDSGRLSLDLLNFPITALSLTFYAYLILRTSRQTQALEKHVRKLEGILPICASCKRIRNESGEYEQMERCISAHSEAIFSHGLCPDCVHKYF
jgi:hypothetical protein